MAYVSEASSLVEFFLSGSFGCRCNTNIVVIQILNNDESVIFAKSIKNVLVLS